MQFISGLVVGLVLSIGVNVLLGILYDRYAQGTRIQRTRKTKSKR